MRDEFSKVFREIQPKFSRLLTRILHQADLSLPQFALLNVLTEQRALSMTELGEKLGITKPAVTHLVDRLEKVKCVKRVAAPKDRRVFLIEIQPKGEKIVRDLRSRILPIPLRTLARFNPDEQQTISKFYSALSATLDQALNLPREK